MKANININGNSRGDFEQAYVALINARDAVDAASKKVMSNVLNGRNYASDDDLIADRRRFQKMFHDIAALIGTMQSEIVNVLE